MRLVCANRSDEDMIYPLTVREISQAQKFVGRLKKCKDMYSSQLVENTEVLCKDGKMVIPVALQNCAVSWYHHYLQYPGHTRLEETLHITLYWRMRGTIHIHVKTAVYVKLTNNTSTSMVNCLLSLSTQTLGKYYVWI